MPVDGPAQQRGGHLERHPRARARLIKEVEESLASQGTLERLGRRRLYAGRRWKQNGLEPVAPELTRVEDVVDHADSVYEVSSRLLRTRAAVPTTTLCGGTLLVTMAPAPMTLSWPMVTP